MAFQPNIRSHVDLVATGTAATDTANLEAALASSPVSLTIDTRDNILTLDDSAGDGIIYCGNTLIRPYRGRGRLNMTNATAMQWGSYWNFGTNYSSLPGITAIGANNTSFTISGVTPVVDDVCVIFADNNLTGMEPHFAGGNQRPGELAKIIAISGGNHYLDRPLLDDFTTTPSLGINRGANTIPMSKGGGLVDFDCTGPNDTSAAFSFYWIDEARFQNNYIERAGGINVVGCFGGSWDGISIDQQNDPVNTYGIVINLCTGVWFRHFRGHMCRHVFTTGGYDDGSLNRYGNPKDCGMVDFDCWTRDTASNILLDTHAEGNGITFARGILSGNGVTGAKYLVQSRSRNTIMRDLKLQSRRGLDSVGVRAEGCDGLLMERCTTDGLWLGAWVRSASASYPSNNATIRDCHFKNQDGSAVLFDGGTGHRVYRCTCDDVASSLAGTAGLQKACVTIDDQNTVGVDDIVISDCDFPKGSNDYSVYLGTVQTAASGESDIRLERNRCTGYGSGTTGIDTASQKANLRRDNRFRLMGNIDDDELLLGDGATTAVFASWKWVRTAPNTSTTTFATGTGGIKGQVIDFFIEDSLTTLQHGTGADQFNLSAAVNWTPGSDGGRIHLEHDGTGWVEQWKESF